MMETDSQVLVDDILDWFVVNHPEKLVVTGLERSITYRQLRERGNLLAQSLYVMGIRPGDHVAMMSYNLPEIAEITVALAIIQAGVVQVGYGMKPPEIEYIVNHSNSKALIFWHEFADRIVPYRDRYAQLVQQGLISLGGSRISGVPEYESLMNPRVEVDLKSIKNANHISESIIYTSGTTGRPKGATRRQSFASMAQVQSLIFSLIDTLNMTSDDIHLVCCPLYHSAPSFFSRLSFMLGGTRVYQPKFHPEQFFEMVDRYKVTSTHLVPTMVVRLLQVPKSFTDKLDISSLRTVVCGAAPLFPQDKLAFIDRFGPILYEYYGSTETGINTIITPDEILQRPSSVGKALEGNELMIMTIKGERVPEGESGVLYAHSPMMFDDYYKNERATQEVTRGKYITVGDIAIRDSDGYFYIIDRIRDMIIRGGVNIYPAEVEKALMEVPYILDVAVVGKPHRELGETVTAFVVLSNGIQATKDEIIAYCRKSLADSKAPTDIYFTDQIPRNPSGKILKNELRAILSKQE